ncbi:LysR substrate-binding domain-containing protein [Pararoseomonas indoligenes]|uniref:LysR family transcriptional regulator n=1 Tax=Roseomonas indoligenes TaxID=2820811 RepID=A0A940S786_9PROT|nr:LysR substrate-binding domain-containing protein [Pararoseomonas indoligenes]MBP0496361.1 LysR family transcriptional regulator [Pararoseomonas indoligenes]
MLNIPPGLDPDLLRSFVLVAEGGSVTRAALRVGRTQSAVSMQMRRLEEALGQPLLLRGSRGLSPTPHGLWLLDRARRLLAMHDEIVANFRAPDITGHIRLGSPDDYALFWLPDILAGFAEAHPAAEVEVVCLPTEELLPRFDRGDLDITLFSVGYASHHAGVEGERIWRGPLCWVGSATRPSHLMQPLPLVLSHGGCSWRQAATEALNKAGIPWRMAYSSASQTGTHAVVLAGLGVTVGLSASLPPGLRLLGQEDGMPALPELEIALVSHPGAAAEALAEHIRRGFRSPPATARAA